MRATEIEVEEKEVEYVYCDKCGDDCTDDVEYEPREVCPSCAEGRSTWKDIETLIDELSHSENNESITVGQALGGVLLLPIIVIATIGLMGDENADTNRNDVLAVVTFTIGSALWTSLIWFILL